MAIATVEDVLTLGELHTFSQKGAVPVARIAMAYGALLRFAGANVDNDTVYAGMFGSGDVDPQSAVTNLLALMLPPARMTSKGGDPGKSSPADGISSGTSIKSPSGKNGSRRPNSGH
ncbi:MAG: hypothetical protein ACR2K1_08910 [Saprospiraceae bacterium]